MIIFVRSGINKKMKNQFILLLVLFQLAACDALRPASRNTDNLSANQPNGAKTAQPRFLTGISTESPDATVAGKDQPLYRPTTAAVTFPNSGNEAYDPLQFKYAILTNTAVEELNNPRLLVFMDHWYGVPYHYGGNSMDGIDCSAFACQLVSDVYNVNQLPRMSADQYKATRRVSKKDLREGDLVFFHTLGKGHKVTHVGVYLYNNRFVHASIAGVQISDLGEGYYRQHYVGAGRIIAE